MTIITDGTNLQEENTVNLSQESMKKSPRQEILNSINSEIKKSALEAVKIKVRELRKKQKEAEKLVANLTNEIEAAINDYVENN